MAKPVMGDLPMFAEQYRTGCGAGLEVDVITTPRRPPRAALCYAAALVVIGSWSTGVAGAAPTGFDLSPTSGPPGTVVTASGTGCSPGFTVSAMSDYVLITAPSLQVSVRAPVARDGSWHRSFTVPADANAGVQVLVFALCVSDGLAVLTALYTPQTFDVTAPPAPTTTTPGGTTPTTKPNGSGGTTPTTPGGTSPGNREEPGSTVPVFGGFPPDSSGGGDASPDRGSGPGGSATTRPGAIKADVRRAAGMPAARAADLSAPGLPAARVTASSGLGWLAWLLLAALVIAAVGAPLWLRRSRGLVDDAAGGVA